MVMLVTATGCLAFKNDAVGFIAGLCWHYGLVLPGLLDRARSSRRQSVAEEGTSLLRNTSSGSWYQECTYDMCSAEFTLCVYLTTASPRIYYHEYEWTPEFQHHLLVANKRPIYPVVHNASWHGRCREGQFDINANKQKDGLPSLCHGVNNPPNKSVETKPGTRLCWAFLSQS